MIMNYPELVPLFETIIREFELKGKLVNITCVSAGNINDTYVATTDYYGSERQYIVQRINHKVFTSPNNVARNVCAVTDYVEKRMRSLGVPDYRRKVMKYYRMDDGRYYYVTPEGTYWRVLSYVYGSTNTNTVDENLLKSAGKGFGEFQNYLSDFPAECLVETIPDFHNTKKRYKTLIESAEKNTAGRLDEVREEYEYLLSMRKKAEYLCELHDSGLLPYRVVHNDTKCNNVMFDIETGANLAVIDLDTVMPGLVAYDFGDAVRFAANPGGEDNENLGEIYLDIEYYKAFAEGFVPCLYGKVNPLEIDTLPDGVLAITLELAARFLTDYLDGDVYFKCKKDRHNLHRTRAQIALAKDIDVKMPKLRESLKSIIEEIQE